MKRLLETPIFSSRAVILALRSGWIRNQRPANFVAEKIAEKKHPSRRRYWSCTGTADDFS